MFPKETCRRPTGLWQGALPYWSLGNTNQNHHELSPVFICFSLTNFTERNALKVHPYHCRWQDLLLFMAEYFYGWLIFHCMYAISSSSIHLSMEKVTCKSTFHASGSEGSRQTLSADSGEKGCPVWSLWRRDLWSLGWSLKAPCCCLWWIPLL